MASASKQCRDCGLTKPLDEFSPTGAKPKASVRDVGSRGGTYRRSYCKACANVRNANYRSDKGPEAMKDYYLRLGYGIGLDEFQRMWDDQGGLCAICGVALERGRVKGGSGACVDHCHETGTVRGLLCFNCNTGIGKLGDNANRLLAAAAYLLTFDVLSTEAK